jgi:SAM-dependent methyltransferase
MSSFAARPLDPRWLDVIDRVAPRVLGREDRRGSALVAQIERASELYTRERQAIRLTEGLLAARLRFFLPRDLPKIEGPLAELAALGALPAGPWRVIDLGAGLGASLLGAAALAKRLGIERVDAVAIERDTSSLDVLEQLAREAARADLIAPIALDARCADLEELPRLEQGDVAILGLALNELFVDRDDRLEAREHFLRSVLAQCATVVVIEPAIKSITRELQVLRDRLAPLVFAPCVRDAPCPMLENERDWCHDQLPFALPDMLAELAGDAGLRRERLTYSYLTLRSDGRRLWDLSARDRRTFRIVGGPIVSKGKTEWQACGEPGLVRLRMLDRERRPELDDAARGTLLRLDREPPDGSDLRLRPDVSTERLLR